MSSELAFSGALDLAARIKQKDISSVELLELYFERIDRHNEAVNAVIVQRREHALERARAADEALAKGEDWGPLHGLPMTIKESYDITDTPTTWGEPLLKNNIAKSDALAAERLQNAGAIIFGKTNVPLMLSDFQSYNDVYGTTNNPWDLGRTPGGSSGGSAAALAAGLTGLESGSDIGGSIRNPAHFCGVFGHKPTWNLLPPRGHAMPGILTPSDISVIGPLARSAVDLEAAVRIMAGPDEIQSRGMKLELPQLTKRIDELKIGVWRDDDVVCPVDASVSARVDLVAEALAKAGAQIDYDARPVADPAHTHEVYQFLLNATMSARMPEERFNELHERALELDADDRSAGANMLRAQTARFRDWVAHNEQRTHLRWRWHEFFKDYDFLLTPIMATSAFPHDHGPFGQRTITVNGKSQNYFSPVFWSGLTGVVYLPSTIVPTGPDDQGLPIGVQIIGPEYADLMTIALAAHLEREGFAFQPAPDFAD